MQSEILVQVRVTFSEWYMDNVVVTFMFEQENCPCYDFRLDCVQHFVEYISSSGYGEFCCSSLGINEQLQEALLHSESIDFNANSHTQISVNKDKKIERWSKTLLGWYFVGTGKECCSNIEFDEAEIEEGISGTIGKDSRESKHYHGSCYCLAYRQNSSI